MEAGLAFLRHGAGAGTTLTVVPTAGGTLRELTSAESPAEFERVTGLAWSPDSRYVYYLKRPGATAPYELFRIAAAGGPEEVMGLKADDIRDLDLSPDGTRIAFSICDWNHLEVWAIENFLPSGK